MTDRVRNSWQAYAVMGAIVAAICLAGRPFVNVTAVGPAVLDPRLTVDTVVTGLSQPTSMAFIGKRDILVLEKASGQVRRVKRGVLQDTPVLDLAVNSASERGLLGIALHPDFPTNAGVYLYWTESTATDVNGQVIDSTDLAQTPLLGNRVDRFVWNGSALTFDRNLIRLRAFQADTGQPLRGNHNGGVIRFALTPAADAAADPNAKTAKLFIVIGDEGRRGQLQNLRKGPFGDGSADDQFGGPQPDNAHLTGVVLRLNDDGTAPPGNPFYELGARLGGEVGANLQKVFAYGVRNSFGMAVDPRTGDLWNEENGDDSFDEINRVSAGQNNGWIQVMGPIRRVAEFKEIETSPEFDGLQQIRWPPSNLADTPDQARARLFMLPGAHYRNPMFSWRFAVAPAAIGFLDSAALGRRYDGDLFVGAARTFLDDGYLMRFDLTEDRRRLAFSDARLDDRVADNITKFDATESESLRFGTGFGVATDIQTGPNGNLFVVSLTQGAIYEIRRRGDEPFIAVTNPNGGETWTTGSTQTISWSDNLPSSENVKIELSKDGGATYPITVLSSTPADGSEQVTVAGDWASTTARIRITSISSSAVTDASDANFIIEPAGSDVSIVDFTFVPGTLTVPTGTTVSWKNNGSVQHTTTSDGAGWDSGILAPGATFDFTFDTAGEFPYHCQLHTGMVGKIVVQ